MVVVVSGPNNEFCWTTVYDSGGGVYCAHAMAAVARHDSMSLFGIDNLLSGYGTGFGPKALCITFSNRRATVQIIHHRIVPEICRHQRATPLTGRGSDPGIGRLDRTASTAASIYHVRPDRTPALIRIQRDVQSHVLVGGFAPNFSPVVGSRPEQQQLS